MNLNADPSLNELLVYYLQVGAGFFVVVFKCFFLRFLGRFCRVGLKRRVAHTVCPRSSDHILKIKLLYKMGHYFLDIQ